MTINPPNVEALPMRLRAIARTMLEIGSDMDYLGGFDEMGDHGREMIGAAGVALSWAMDVEAALVGCRR